MIKKPHNDEQIAEVDMIETLIDELFVSNQCHDLIERCLINFGLSFDVDSAIDEVNVLLDSNFFMDTNK